MHADRRKRRLREAGAARRAAQATLRATPLLNALIFMTLPILSLSGLPEFLAYLAVALALLLAFIVIYVRVTSHHEFALIKQNNVAAAVAFGAAVLGFCLPLFSAVSNSVNLVDCAVWGGIALVVQVLAYFVARLTIGDLSGRITRGELAPAIFAAALSLGVGLLNAAAMTY